jgi:hypothetical protein
MGAESNRAFVLFFYQNLLARDNKERKSVTKGRKPGKGSLAAKKMAAYGSDESEDDFKVSYEQLRRWCWESNRTDFRCTH